jgi:hypothetical protein
MAAVVVLSETVQAGAYLAARHYLGVMGRMCLRRQPERRTYEGELPGRGLFQRVVWPAASGWHGSHGKARGLSLRLPGRSRPAWCVELRHQLAVSGAGGP